MYGLMMSAREFSSDEPEEDMVPLKLRMAPDRNRSKQKHDEKMIYRPRAIRGLYRQNFNNKMKAQEETGAKMSSEATSPPCGAASRGLRHGVVWCLWAPFPTRFCLVIFHI
jgi:hypothetical protein